MSVLVDREDLIGRLFFPRPDVSEVPAGAEDRMLEVPSARLHLRRHAAHLPNVILLCHGNGETLAAWDAAGRAMASRGWSLVSWDYRGYGRSTGVPTFRRLLSDGASVLAEVQRWAPGRLVLFGRSLGSRIAWELARGVEAVIIDSGFTDVDAFARRRGIDPRALPEDERALIDPLPRIAEVRAPVLLLHGEEDQAIAIAEAEVAARACGGELVRLPGVGHNDLYTHPRYDEALARFLARLADVSA